MNRFRQPENLAFSNGGGGMAAVRSIPIRHHIDTQIGLLSADQSGTSTRAIVMPVGVQASFRIGEGGLLWSHFSRLDALGRGSVTCHSVPFDPMNCASCIPFRSSRMFHHVSAQSDSTMRSTNNAITINAKLAWMWCTARS